LLFLNLSGHANGCCEIRQKNLWNGERNWGIRKKSLEAKRAAGIRIKLERKEILISGHYILIAACDS
jgi:hypothetical protein